MSDQVSKIADAVMYEGYSLYPYRSSALKNRQRWHFGVLHPREFCEREDANDVWVMQTECLVSGAVGTSQFEITVRFLQLLPESCIAREIRLNDLRVTQLSQNAHAHDFAFPGLNGCVEISMATLERAQKLAVRIINLTPFPEGHRETAMLHAMASTHAILRVCGGEFVSAIDPPTCLKECAARCKNVGAWPVLIGERGSRDTMLSAPIILEDHPRIAVQSTGDHFDCTEIDEMLALRILTLTEHEKQQMRNDERTRAMLERTESLKSEQLSKLHAIIREADHRGYKKGARVRLRPRGRADIFDIALDGKTAVVESVEQDFEDRIYITVTLEDDPGKDLGVTGQPGHRFFFRPDELEALDD